MESLQETCRIFFFTLTFVIELQSAQSLQLFINATPVQFGHIWFCVSDDPAEAK